MRVSISNVMYTKNKNKSFKNCKYYDEIKHVISCLFSATIHYDNTRVSHCEIPPDDVCHTETYNYYYN